MLDFVWNIWKYRWNETDDGILPVNLHKFSELWNLIVTRSHGKLFSVLFQAIIYVFSFKIIWKNDCKKLKLSW